MDPSTTTPADVTIATIVDELARDFISLADALSLTTESRFATQVPSTAIYDEFSRFKLWAGNIAAHRKGRRSLEYRLRDAAHLKSQTHSLLDALSTALCNALLIASGERVPWDELSPSDTDSDSDMSDHANSNADLQGSTELTQLIASVKTLITSLFRLSMAIRNPAPDSQSTSTISIDKSFYEQHDIQHVMEKFPHAPQYLVERLGRALSARRQYLIYREEHHQKLTKNIEKIGFEEATTEFTTNSTEATPIPRIGRSMSLDVLDEEDDAASQTSYATSVNATIRAPSLPGDASNKDFFECPLCFLLVSIHTAAGWKQHVFRDLHPYCCTHKHCTIADRLYDSRKAWFAHELEVHRTAWQCVEGCGRTFEVESDFETHVRKNHSELASASMFSALKRTSATSADLGGKTQCTLCGKYMALRALQRHLGNHQQQLALFALPPSLEDTEDDPNDDDGELEIAGNIDEEELSDLSDTSDPEGVNVADLNLRDMDDDDLFEVFGKDLQHLRSFDQLRSLKGDMRYLRSSQLEKVEAHLRRLNEPEKVTGESVQLRQEETNSSLHDISRLREQLETGQATSINPTSKASGVNSWMQGVTNSEEPSDVNAQHGSDTEEPLAVSVETNEALDGLLAHATSDSLTVLHDTTSQREEGGTTRVWPGMHQGQAAVAMTEAQLQRVLLNPDTSISNTPGKEHANENFSLDTERPLESETASASTANLEDQEARQGSRMQAKQSVERGLGGNALERDDGTRSTLGKVDVVSVGLDASKVWNKNQPVLPPPPNHSTKDALDRELRDAQSLLERLQKREDLSDDFWESVGLTRSFGDSQRVQEGLLDKETKPYIPKSVRTRSDEDLNSDENRPVNIRKVQPSGSRETLLANTSSHRIAQDPHITDLETNLEKMERAASCAAADHKELGRQLSTQRHSLDGMRVADGEMAVENMAANGAAAPQQYNNVLHKNHMQLMLLEQELARQKQADQAGSHQQREFVERNEESREPEYEEMRHEEDRDRERREQEEERAAIIAENRAKMSEKLRKAEEESDRILAELKKDRREQLRFDDHEPRGEHPTSSPDEWDFTDEDEQYSLYGRPDSPQPPSRRNYLYVAPDTPPGNSNTTATRGVHASPVTESPKLTDPRETDQTIIQLRREEEGRKQEEKKEHDAFFLKQKEQLRIWEEEAAAKVKEEAEQSFGWGLFGLTKKKETTKQKREREAKEKKEREKQKQEQYRRETLLEDRERAPRETISPPTYAKVHRTHLEVETLHYYDIPYEYDIDPNYIIVLREMSQRETDILFEHTRRLRTSHGGKLFIEAEGKDNRGKKEYAVLRKKSGTRSRSMGDSGNTGKIEVNDSFASISQVDAWIEKKKANTLTARPVLEDDTDALKDRDQIFIVDNSESMAQYRSEVKRTLGKQAER